MTSQEDALGSLARALDALSIPYMVIGGHANAVWGAPRSTVDIDVTLWLDESRISDLIEALAPCFFPRVADPAAFVRDTRVLPVATKSGLGADLIFGMLPFEDEAIRRARPIAIGGYEVRFCTPEDLILLKIVSDREQDLADIRGVVRLQGERLDLEYLEIRIEELADLLERPQILAFWRSARDEGLGI